MSYFATTRCPKCGKKQQLHLGGLRFYGNETTICSYCDSEYSSVFNCIDMNVTRDEPPVKSNHLANVSTEEFQKDLEKRLATFSIKELEKELKKRKSL